MKAFAAAVVVSIALAYGAAWVLNNELQTTAASAFTTDGARVSNPGENLVGPNWTGNADEG